MIKFLIILISISVVLVDLFFANGFPFYTFGFCVILGIYYVIAPYIR
jgi:hypothetical protein